MRIQNVNLTYKLKEEINKWVHTKNKIEGTPTNTTITISSTMINYINKHKPKGTNKKSLYIRKIIFKYINKLNRVFKSPTVLFHSRNSFINTAIIDYYSNTKTEVNEDITDVMKYMFKNGYNKIKTLN